MRYGEFLGKIARKFGVKIADIKRWNNLKNDNIKENQKLIIFPNWMPHFTKKNISDDIRISISGNAKANEKDYENIMKNPGGLFEVVGHAS